MRYRLVMTTCGREGLLDDTLRSFLEQVSPSPSSVAIVDDSGDGSYRQHLEDLLPDVFPEGVHLLSHPVRMGFCETVADAWQCAANPGVEWVYWLEDDFRHCRKVDLRELADVLGGKPQLAQMALYRNPVSPEEKEAGGYVKLNPDDYVQRGTVPHAWMEHRRHWTTNPALLRRSFAAEYGSYWPRAQAQCEGKFGFELRERRPDTSFGLWGSGEPWVIHTGERQGIGY